MTTKIHALVDALGNPVEVMLSPGQDHDLTLGILSHPRFDCSQTGPKSGSASRSLSATWRDAPLAADRRERARDVFGLQYSLRHDRQRIDKARHEALCEVLNERDRRLHTASEAKALGRGGIAAVSRTTGVARSTIGRGLKDLASPEWLANGRVRREAGRKPLTEADPTLISDLEALVEPDSRGDPMSPLRWTCKSLRVLAVELGFRGADASRLVDGSRLHQVPQRSRP